LESRGIPVATVCTDEFAPLGQTEAEALGMPTLPIVSIPHPIGSLKLPELHAVADAAFEELLHVLTGPSEELAREYRGRYQQAPLRPLKTKPVFR
jgi:hypothetical protein